MKKVGLLAPLVAVGTFFIVLGIFVRLQPPPRPIVEPPVVFSTRVKPPKTEAPRPKPARAAPRIAAREVPPPAVPVPPPERLVQAQPIDIAEILSVDGRPQQVTFRPDGTIVIGLPEPDPRDPAVPTEPTGPNGPVDVSLEPEGAPPEPPVRPDPESEPDDDTPRPRIQFGEPVVERPLVRPIEEIETRPVRPREPVLIEMKDYPASAAVVINEVHYHPAGDLSTEEWVELFNRSTKAVDLGGWKLDGGFNVTFPPKTMLKSGELVVVARDKERLAALHGIANVVGNAKGELANGDQTIRLLDAAGKPVDAFTYSDGKKFPSLADGGGRSLERRDPHFATEFAGNWGASDMMGWRKVEGQGAAISSRMYIYLEGRATAFVDDLKLTPIGHTGPAWSCGFEAETGQWSSNGNHAQSKVDATVAHDGASSLKVSAQGAGSSQSNSVTFEIPGLEAGKRYKLEAWVFVSDPRIPLTFRSSRTKSGSGKAASQGAASEGSTAGALAIKVTGGSGTSPGRPNSLLATKLPPYVVPGRLTREDPLPDKPIELVTSVVAQNPDVKVVLVYDDGVSRQRAPMERGSGSGPKAGPASDESKEKPDTAKDPDPPKDPDVSKNDRKTDRWPGEDYHVTIGPFKSGTVVRWRVEAEEEASSIGTYPLAGDASQWKGFYVEARAQKRAFPTFQLFVSPEALQDIQQNPHSDALRPATLVYDGEVFCDVGVRYRGHTSRSIPKPHWKIKLPRDHRLDAPWGGKVRSLNLNSSFADKAFLRETLSYALWRDMGEMACETRYARMEMNGKYHGFYVALETPNEDFLGRYEAQGWLWKSYCEARQANGQFQIEAGDQPSGDPLLREFVGKMNLLRGKELEEYIRENMNVPSFVNYLVGCQLVHSSDHIAKNYLVYLSPERKFTFLPWDMDLTYGRNYECDGGRIWNDTIRYNLWDDETGDERLLFGTRSHPKCDGFWNGILDGFLNRTEAFRPLYYKTLAANLAHYTHPEVLLLRLQPLVESIREEAAQDRRLWPTYGRGGDFDRHYRQMTQWVRDRAEHLEAKLKALGYPVPKPMQAQFDLANAKGAVPFTAKFLDRSIGQISSRKWDFGDGATSGEKEPIHVYKKPGKFTVTLTVRSGSDSHTRIRREVVNVKAKD